MTTPVRRRSASGCTVLALSFVIWIAVSALGASPSSLPSDEQMPIPGGTTALLERHGITGAIEPARALLVLIRGTYGGVRSANSAPLPPAHAVPTSTAAGQETDKADSVPALLPLSTWQTHVFRKPIAAADLADAILADRRAALLYYGLFSLDEPTLSYFVAHPAIISAIYADSAAVFAAFGEGITIDSGRVVLPGDEEAAAVWQELAGAPAAMPGDFVRRLLERDEGRLAWMFDTIGHLDGGRQGFALGRFVADRETRAAYMKAVYSVFAGFQRSTYRLPVYPFERAQIDPAYVLASVGATADGRLSPPAKSAVWRAVFGVTDPSAFEAVTAPWLLAQVLAMRGRSRLDTVLFAQRLSAMANRVGSRVDSQVLPEVLAAFAEHDALMLSLEQLGLADPADYAGALRAAAALTGGVNDLDASLHVAMFQGALALLLRMHDVDALDDATTRLLARALVALPSQTPDGYGAALSDWMEHQVVPALARGRPSTSMDADAWLLDGLSGVSEGRATTVVQWEDRAYRVDIAGAERLRLREAIGRQRTYPLSLAFELRHLASSARGAVASHVVPASAVRSRLADLVSRIDVLTAPTMFGHAVPSYDALRDTEARMRDGRAADVVDELRSAFDLLMADSMAAHAYALGVEDPDASIWLVDRPARSHQFGAAPWKLAVDAPPVVRGSLLGMARILARLSLRRATLEPPRRAPVLMRPDSDSLAEAVVAMNAFHLTDAGRDTVASGLQRGRDRIAAAIADPATLDELASRIGVDRWRRRLMHWAASRDPERVAAYLSLAEILALGCSPGEWAGAQMWGVPARGVDGSFNTRVPMPLAWRSMAGRRGGGVMAAQVADLPLRVAELLAQMKLPAPLARGVFQYATWDVDNRVRMTYLDDWFALMREAQQLTAEEVTDYVSALTANGPLIPVK